MPVCSGGAALRTPSDPAAATFQELLERVPHGLRCIIALICGNHFFASGCSCGAPKCEAAAKRLGISMKQKAEKVFAVAGGSSERVIEKDWRIDYGAFLGAGTFGMVYQGTHEGLGVPCGVKCMDVQRVCAHPE